MSRGGIEEKEIKNRHLHHLYEKKERGQQIATPNRDTQPGGHLLPGPGPDDETVILIPHQLQEEKEESPRENIGVEAAG